MTNTQAATDFTRRHIGPAAADIEKMLKTVNAWSLDELMAQTIPASIRQAAPLDFGEALSETRALQRMRELADKNQVFTSLIGQGYSGTILPPVIQRNILENPAWYTAYTPYQPEISQGRLEALINYQTMICDLTGLDVANASLLDEATAAAEAMALAKRVTKSKSNAFFVDHNVHPQTLALLQTRSEPLGWSLIVGDPFTDLANADVFGAIFQYPGTDGAVRDFRAVIAALKTKGGIPVMAPEFMPPEQAQGRRDVDARSDVWGVGATLFTIISGAFVHDDAQTIHEALIASATRRPRPLRELVPSLSRAVAEVIDRSLELEMSDRWESAMHMREALLSAQGVGHEATPGKGKYDSETALAMPTSRRRPDVVLVTDDTMQDSQPVDVRSNEVEIAATYADTGRARQQRRSQQPPPQQQQQQPSTARMANRPSRPPGPPPGQFRPPMQTPSEEHETFAAPGSMPPRSSMPGSMPPPRASMPGSMPPPPHSNPPHSHAHHSQRPILDPMEPTPIVSLSQRPPMPTVPPEYMPMDAGHMDPTALVPRSREKRESKETKILLGLALFFLCAAAGAYMMRRPRR